MSLASQIKKFDALSFLESRLIGSEFVPFACLCCKVAWASCNGTAKKPCRGVKIIEDRVDLHIEFNKKKSIRR